MSERVCQKKSLSALSFPFSRSGEPCQSRNRRTILRDDYLKEAHKIIPDPNALINVVSRRAKQLKFGNKPLVESLERLEPEDIALREIIEGKISYQPFDEE